MQTSSTSKTRPSKVPAPSLERDTVSCVDSNSDLIMFIFLQFINEENDSKKLVDRVLKDPLTIKNKFFDLLKLIHEICEVNYEDISKFSPIEIFNYFERKIKKNLVKVLVNEFIERNFYPLEIELHDANLLDTPFVLIVKDEMMNQIIKSIDTKWKELYKSNFKDIKLVNEENIDFYKIEYSKVDTPIAHSILEGKECTRYEELENPFSSEEISLEQPRFLYFNEILDKKEGMQPMNLTVETNTPPILISCEDTKSSLLEDQTVPSGNIIGNNRITGANGSNLVEKRNCGLINPTDHSSQDIIKSNNTFVELEGKDLNKDKAYPTTSYNSHIEKNEVLKDSKIENSSLFKTIPLEKDTPGSIRKMESSLITLEYPFTIPGGRFREFYYWDSYWIMDGQLICKMYETVFTSLLNFVNLINTYGYIPNGTRTYYKDRSQPPYFASSVENFYNRAPHIYKMRILSGPFLDAIEKEYNFWMKSRSIEFDFEGKKEILNRYFVETKTPRPESITEDLRAYQQALNKITSDGDFDFKFSNKSEDVEHQHKKKEYKNGDLPNYNKQYDRECKFYGNIKAACESGWDFSTRWFRDHQNLYTICTSEIIPVDLNSILYKNEKIISKFYRLKGNLLKSHDFTEKANQREIAINRVLWQDKNWADYNFISKKHTKTYFYFSNITPMLFGIKPPTGTIYNILLESYDFLTHIGGAPVSSAINSNEQWDYPNVFPPLQEMLVSFLVKNNERDFANLVAASFYRSVETCFFNKRCFYEKYRCDIVDVPGHKGEYKCQKGFGWTNGITLRFIELFGDDLKKDLEWHQEAVHHIKKTLISKKNQ